MTSRPLWLFVARQGRVAWLSVTKDEAGAADFAWLSKVFCCTSAASLVKWASRFSSTLKAVGLDLDFRTHKEHICT
jgi:hypothetical protein